MDTNINVLSGVTAKRFVAWVNAAKPGSRYSYHLGNLMLDRGPEGNRNRDIDKIARTAWMLYERGYITLVQRRVDKDTCLYIAERL